MLKVIRQSRSQDANNAVYMKAGEVHSYTFGILILTGLNSFDYMHLNINLTQTRSSYSDDTNCLVGKNFDYKYELSQFSESTIELLTSKYVYAEYADILCPLSLFNTSLTVGGTNFRRHVSKTLFLQR